MDADVLIVGAGISGLSLAYFLEKERVENIVIIDKKKEIGVPVRDTGLVSDAILQLLPFIRKSILTSFKKAVLHYKSDNFEILTLKRRMLLLDRELFDKLIFNKIKDTQVFLKTRLENINQNRSEAITNKFNIKYKVIIDASGPLGVVRKHYGLSNKSFVIGIESGAKVTNEDKKIEIFLDKEISSKYFGWILQYKNNVKIGLIDKNLKYMKFKKFYKASGFSKFDWFYADIIKNSPEEKIVSSNMLCVGESSGYLKQFSLGGIIFGIIQAKIASQVIKKFLEEDVRLDLYEYIVKKLFWKSNLVSNCIRILLKNRVVFKLVKLSKLNRITQYLDLDTYLPTDLRKVIS